MLYVLHGEEEFTRSEVVAELKTRIAADGLGDLNVATLDGRRISLGELMAACDAMPFLGDRRLVIVEGLISRMGGRPRGRRKKAARDAAAEPDADEWERLADYLPRLPPTTRLVLIEATSLPANHPLLALAATLPKSEVREYRQLAGGELEAWIRRRAKDKGVEITAGATRALVAETGNGLRALDAELEKLAAYGDYRRAITEEDVHALVIPNLEAGIFELVDTLGARNRPRAMNLLEQMLADRANELYLLTMIVRQVRLILGIKDMLAEGNTAPAEIGRLLGVRHGFLVEKLGKQARQFEMEELEAILRRTLEIDQGIKTGRIDGRLALELLAVEICSRRSGAAAASGTARPERAARRA